jgi:hypothetical protein
LHTLTNSFSINYALFALSDKSMGCDKKNIDNLSTTSAFNNNEQMFYRQWAWMGHM